MNIRICLQKLKQYEYAANTHAKELSITNISKQLEQRPKHNNK